MRRLAEMAMVSTNTITRFEKSDQPSDEPTSSIKVRTIQAIQAALESAGATFLNEGDVAAGPGVALK